MSDHFNVRVFIEHVVKDEQATYPRNDPSKASRVIHPVEVKVSANSLESAVRKAKAFLDIEVAEQ